MANSSLSAIQNKVRLLTRSPSTQQLTDAALNEYINTFVLYDFPEHLRTFNLHKTFTFYTNPLQDRYPTDIASFVGVTTNPLYDFQNKYLTVNPPVYIAGFQSFYGQSREQFFGIYPKVNNILSIGTTGDGITTQFTGVVNSQQALFPPSSGIVQNICLLQNEVLFSSVGVNGGGLALIDVPVMDTVTGNPTINGNLYVPGQTPLTPPTVITPNNTINYKTGVFTITFPNPPAAGVLINSQTVPQILSLPQALLFYENTFFVRPVPDQPYRVNFEVYVRPTELLASNQEPELNEYWQLIAYGAAKKVFQDRSDTDSVAQIEPEYREQMRLVLRRTLVQQTNQRTASIYTEQTGYGPGSGGWGWGNGGPF